MTTNPMTHRQATTLAAFIHELRGDWDTHGVLDAIGKARDLAPGPDLACAAIRAASLASNRTPAVIGMDGPHWRGTTAAPRFETPAKADTCSVCYQRRDVCRSRWAGDHEFVPLTQVAAGRSLSPAEVRAELLRARGLLCPHGVDRARTKCRDCERPAPVATEQEADA